MGGGALRSPRLARSTGGVKVAQQFHELLVKVRFLSGDEATFGRSGLGM